MSTRSPPRPSHRAPEAGGSIRRWLVAPSPPPRLDAFLAARLPAFSEDRLRGLLARGSVRVDGTVAKPLRRLHGGETVELELPAPARLAPVEGPPLTVLVDRDDLLVVDKPAGVTVEPEPGHLSVVELAATQLAGFDVGGAAAPGVVHRLDRGTTGCLVLAKTDDAQVLLLDAFQHKRVDKVYLALVQGHPPCEGQLDTPYAKDPRRRGRFTTQVASPRRARLSFRVAERLPAPGSGPDAALLEVNLDTGRTHQIRVQLAEAGFPLLGDEVYGVRDARTRLGRPALHAARLTIEGVGPRVETTAPLPEDFELALRALRAAWVVRGEPEDEPKSQLDSRSAPESE